MSTTRNAGRQLIKAALEAGFTVAVHYEQDDKPAMTRKGTEHLTALWLEATACDEATVYITDDYDQSKGWAYLVHWNEGDEVISDHGSKGWVNAWAEATNYGQRTSLVCPHLRLDPDHRPVKDRVLCIDCGRDDLVFEGANEYEPDPITGDPRCFQCDLAANPDRYGEHS